MAAKHGEAEYIYAYGYWWHAPCACLDKFPRRGKMIPSTVLADGQAVTWRCEVCGKVVTAEHGCDTRHGKRLILNRDSSGKTRFWEEGKRSDDGQPELDYLEQHYQELKQQYWHKWVAISGSTLVAVAGTLEDVIDQARKAGCGRPLVTCINESWEEPFWGMESCGRSG